jgi:flavodoxin
MPKVIVIYHSQQFGDTKTLAEALAEGVREDGVFGNGGRVFTLEK